MLMDILIQLHVVHDNMCMSFFCDEHLIPVQSRVKTFFLQKADINNCKFVFNWIFIYKTKKKTPKIIDVNLTQANCEDRK